MSKKAKPRAKPRPKAASSGSSSKFWPGILLGGIIAASAFHFGPALLKDDEAQTSAGETRGSSAATKTKTPPGTHPAGLGSRETAPAKPKTTATASATPPSAATAPARSQTPPVPKAPGGLPFFRDPARAADLLTRLGMGESFPGSLLWKKADALGWNAFGVLTTSGSPVSTNGAANTVSCLLESKRADQVEALRLIANTFSSKGDDITLARFRSLAMAVLNETRCPATREFLDAIDGQLGLHTESPEGRYTLSRSPLAPGTRWELTVESR